MRRIMLALALALCSFGAAQAQDRATIEDASWLVGRWEGEGFGGQLEEVWSAPVGNQMVGHFRMIQNGQPAFYEFLLIEEHEGTLRYRVKHFNPDFVGWEEKDGFHEFGWVSASDNELAFDGLILRRISDDVSDHIIRTRSADGRESEQVLRYRRVGD